MDVERVLDEIGLDIESIIDGEFVVFCPFHDNNRTPAGEVEMSTGMFYCFSCNATANLQELVMKVSGCSIFEAMRIVRSNESNVDILSAINKSMATTGPKFEPFDESVVDRLHYSCVTSQRGVDYWYSRGLTDESVDLFRLGYSVTQDMAITPLHTAKGMLMGFQARSLEGKEFKNSTGLKKSKTLFNIHRVRSVREIVIVESPIDAMLLSQVGIPAVASMGATISKAQLELLTSHYNSVIIIPDADQAGKEMTTKLRTVYGGGLTVINLPEGIKDVGELSKEQREYLANKVKDPLFGLAI